MTISGERTEQLDIFCHVTGFKSDLLSFIDVELIRFFQVLSRSPSIDTSVDVGNIHDSKHTYVPKADILSM